MVLHRKPEKCLPKEIGTLSVKVFLVERGSPDAAFHTRRRYTSAGLPLTAPAVLVQEIRAKLEQAQRSS